MSWYRKSGPLIGFSLALAVAGVLVIASFTLGTSPWPNLLLLVSGGLIGWIVGILMTPVGSDERKKFPEYGKALSAVTTGYLVAKLDKLFELSVPNAAAITELFVDRILIFVSAFALGALSTFIWRTYVSAKTEAGDGRRSVGGAK